jgi:ABC-2 type transport system ATP-binding protein
MTPAIEIRNLRKTYAAGKKSPAKEALKGIDLTVPRGSFFDRSSLIPLLRTS